jgi:hypothetical protein
MKSLITTIALAVMFLVASDAEACKRKSRRTTQQDGATTVVRQRVTISATTQCSGVTTQERFGAGCSGSRGLGLFRRR